nr:protein SOGA3-like [Leptinotarsa decemlineata]
MLSIFGELMREEQAVEYASLKKELDQTTKNCRILSFKLRKSERKLSQVESEKAKLETQWKKISETEATSNAHEQYKKFNYSVLSRLKEESQKIQIESSESNISDGMANERSSKDERVSRAAFTRGGSQDDSAQLLRDLQDSLEREADLKEQLKFAEEEVS